MVVYQVWDGEGMDPFCFFKTLKEAKAEADRVWNDQGVATSVTRVEVKTGMKGVEKVLALLNRSGFAARSEIVYTAGG